MGTASPNSSPPQPLPESPRGAVSLAPTMSIPFSSSILRNRRLLGSTAASTRIPGFTKGNQHPKGTLVPLCLFRGMLDPQQLGWGFLWGRSLVDAEPSPL